MIQETVEEVKDLITYSVEVLDMTEKCLYSDLRWKVMYRHSRMCTLTQQLVLQETVEYDISSIS